MYGEDDKVEDGDGVVGVNGGGVDDVLETKKLLLYMVFPSKVWT